MTYRAYEMPKNLLDQAIVFAASLFSIESALLSDFHHYGSAEHMAVRMLLAIMDEVRCMCWNDWISRNTFDNKI